MTLGEIATTITALTLVVTNLTALFSALKANGAVKAILGRLDDHSRRITTVNQEVKAVAIDVAAEIKQNGIH